jgi:hypothetical protein
LTSYFYRIYLNYYNFLKFESYLKLFKLNQTVNGKCYCASGPSPTWFPVRPSCLGWLLPGWQPTSETGDHLHDALGGGGPAVASKPAERASGGEVLGHHQGEAVPFSGRGGQRLTGDWLPTVVGPGRRRTMAVAWTGGQEARWLGQSAVRCRGEDGGGTVPWPGVAGDVGGSLLIANGGMSLLIAKWTTPACFGQLFMVIGP